MNKLRQKLFIICLCLMLMPGLGACGRSGAPRIEEGCINIVCTVFPAYDFTREIAGDRANVILLLPPGAETHSFEPTPQDMTALIGCDLVIANGGVGESWLDSLISGGEITAPVLHMLDCVSLLEEETVEGMQEAGHAHEHDESCEDEHGHEHHGEEAHEHAAEYDEHVWTSPVNAVKICVAIAEAVSAADPENREYYENRLASYTEKLIALDGAFREIVESAVHRSMIFADRFPVRYFVEEYGLDYYAAFPGCAEDTEPSAKTVAFLIDKVREEGIGAVYYIEFSNGKMADVIVEDTGCKKLLFHSCQNVSTDEFESGIGYLDIMEQNLVNLKEGLN